MLFEKQARLAILILISASSWDLQSAGELQIDSTTQTNLSVLNSETVEGMLRNNEASRASLIGVVQNYADSPRILGEAQIILKSGETNCLSQADKIIVYARKNRESLNRVSTAIQTSKIAEVRSCDGALPGRTAATSLLPMVAALEVGCIGELVDRDSKGAARSLASVFDLALMCADDALVQMNIHKSIQRILSCSQNAPGWSVEVAGSFALSLQEYLDAWPQEREVLMWKNYQLRGRKCFQQVREEKIPDALQEMDFRRYYDSLKNKKYDVAADEDIFLVNMRRIADRSHRPYFQRDLDTLWKDITQYGDWCMKRYGIPPFSILLLPNRDVVRRVSEYRCCLELWCDGLLLLAGKQPKYLVSSVTGEKYDWINDGQSIRVHAARSWHEKDITVVISFPQKQVE